MFSFKWKFVYFRFHESSKKTPPEDGGSATSGPLKRFPYVIRPAAKVTYIHFGWGPKPHVYCTIVLVVEMTRYYDVNVCTCRAIKINWPISQNILTSI